MADLAELGRLLADKLRSGAGQVGTLQGLMGPIYGETLPPEQGANVARVLGGAVSGALAPAMAIGEMATGQRPYDHDAAIGAASQVAFNRMMPARVPVNPGEVALGAGPIKAYHGSPHDFDRFDLSKIGTGEGAQAYGHGLYFAENEGVAKAYRDALKWKGSDWNDPQYVAGFWNKQFQGDAPQAIQYLEKSLRHQSTPEAQAAVTGAIDLLRGGNVLKDSPNPGRMYEVAIHADPERFLDWDRPLSAQPQPVQRALGTLGIKPQKEELAAFDDALLAALQGDGPATLPKQPADPMGSMLYRGNGSVFQSTSDPERSQALREAGIPGIRYLDQGSRDAGDGSRNYVTFSDDIVEILRKYGLAGLGVGLPAFAAAQAQGQLSALAPRPAFVPDL